MYPPSSAAHLNLEALSGICGSISIACWVVVFSPQIIENFNRKSADGLSLLFLIVWLAGDVFNILGAVFQGVLPTMTILAVYYTLADIVLLAQCFYYRGFILADDDVRKQQQEQEPALGEPQASSSTPEQPPQIQERSQNGTGQGTSEQTPLLNHRRHSGPAEPTRRSSLASISSLRERFRHVDGTHLSPAMPFIEQFGAPASTVRRPPSTLQVVAFNTFSVALVCAAGVLGWYVSVVSSPRHDKSKPPALTFDIAGQVFGYLCAALYLVSRIPQLLLNWRRRSTEGVSLLFFLFACIGNLTYVLSIFAFSPVCAGKDGRCQPGEQQQIYGRYLLVNASWLLGSLGTLFLDLAIFTQFILYREKGECEGVNENE